MTAKRFRLLSVRNANSLANQTRFLRCYNEKAGSDGRRLCDFFGGRNSVAEEIVAARYVEFSA